MASFTHLGLELDHGDAVDGSHVCQAMRESSVMALDLQHGGGRRSSWWATDEVLYLSMMWIGGTSGVTRRVQFYVAARPAEANTTPSNRINKMVLIFSHEIYILTRQN